MPVTKRRLPEPGPLVLSTTAPLLIPKVIHRVWFGPMLNFHLVYGQAMREMYPDWEIAEWREEHVKGHDYAPIIQGMIGNGRYRAASDVFRIVLLNKYGGFYVDSDAEPLASAVDALRGREVLLVRETRNNILNGFQAAVPQHPLLQYMLSTLEQRLSTHKGAADFQTGPWWTTAVFFDFLDSGITWPLSPVRPFLPYSMMQLIGRGGNQEMVKGSREYPDGTLFAHHWASERRKPGKRKANWALDLREVR